MKQRRDRRQGEAGRDRRLRRRALEDVSDDDRSTTGTGRGGSGGPATRMGRKVLFTPRMVDKGETVVGDYQIKASCPRPNDLAEAVWSTFPVAEALRPRPELAE